MFTLNQGIPIALVKGGENNGELLSVSTEIENSVAIPNDPIDLLDEVGFFKTLKKKPKKNFDALRKIMVEKTGYIDPEIEELYNKAKETLKQRAGKEFFLRDGGELQLLPDPSGNREQIWLAASTGSGKTYFASQYLEVYHKLFPERPIFIITKDVFDETFQKFNFNPVFINVEEKDEKGNYKILSENLEPEFFANSAVFFDDIDYLPEKIQKSVIFLRSQLMGVGRHHNTTVLMTGHQITEYKKTRMILSEAKYIVIYPQSGTVRGVEYFLKNYMGFEKEDYQRILNLPSRWVVVHTRYPQWIMYKEGAFMVSEMRKKKETN